MKHIINFDYFPLAQVEQLLLDDPKNDEYLGIYEGLSQVSEIILR